jgi:transposase InsO family protein
VIHRLSASSSPIITPNSNNPSPVPSFFFILRPFFVGTTGDSYDNALAESIIGLFKTEVIRRLGPWRHLEAVEFATLDWVDWFNHRRLLEPLGYVPPAEYEARYYEQAAVA